MKTQFISNKKLIGVFSVIALLFLSEIAEAQYGRARRTRRRTAVIVGSAVHASDEQAAADASKQADTSAQKSAATTSTDASKSTASTTTTSQTQDASQKAASKGEKLAIGTVVTKLPDGCVATPVNNIQYYHCGDNYFRAVYQENNLVYIQPATPR